MTTTWTIEKRVKRLAEEWVYKQLVMVVQKLQQSSTSENADLVAKAYDRVYRLLFAEIKFHAQALILQGVELSVTDSPERLFGEFLEVAREYMPVFVRIYEVLHRESPKTESRISEVTKEG